MLIPRLVPVPLDPKRNEEEGEQEEEDEPGLSWIPRHSIEYRGRAGDVEEFLEPPPEDWRLVEGRIPPGVDTVRFLLIPDFHHLCFLSCIDSFFCFCSFPGQSWYGWPGRSTLFAPTWRSGPASRGMLGSLSRRDRSSRPRVVVVELSLDPSGPADVASPASGVSAGATLVVAAPVAAAVVFRDSRVPAPRLVPILGSRCLMFLCLGVGCRGATEVSRVLLEFTCPQGSRRVILFVRCGAMGWVLLQGLPGVSLLQGTGLFRLVGLLRLLRSLRVVRTFPLRSGGA